jgi:hypothetical protein
MTRRSDQLNRIEATLGRVEGALGKIADALNPDTPGGVAAVTAEAKGARSSAEAAFAGVQALASVATAKPGPAELAAAVKSTGDAVRQVHAMITAAVAPPAVAAPKASPAGSAGTSGRGKGAA